jgi:hypothetical protein
VSGTWWHIRGLRQPPHTFQALLLVRLCEEGTVCLSSRTLFRSSRKMEDELGVLPKHSVALTTDAELLAQGEEASAWP